MVKTPKGELTGAELRKLIKAHNILVSIKIPKGTDREGLIKLIEDKGYKVDHKKKAIIDSNDLRKKFIANEVVKMKPKVVGIYRLVMKEGSDNFRESSIQKIIRFIVSEGIKVIIYEPLINDESFADFEGCHQSLRRPHVKA